MKAIHRSTPVSYTHLDVYKRQDSEGIIPFSTITAKDLNEVKKIEGMDYSGSVSYTHLDVYKRQSVPCMVKLATKLTIRDSSR